MLDRLVRKLVTAPAYQVPQRMAAKGVSAQKYYVYRQYNGPDADAEAIRKLCRRDRIVGKNDDKDQCKIKKIPVNILQDQGEFPLTPIA